MPSKLSHKVIMLGILTTFLVFVSPAIYPISAALSSGTTNKPSGVSTGVVSLLSNGSSEVALNFTNIQPYSTTKQCIPVEYNGTWPQAKLYLYGEVNIPETPVVVSISRGSITDPRPNHSCYGFTPNTVKIHPTQPAGLIYSGKSTSFPTSAFPIIDPTALNDGASTTYMFEISALGAVKPNTTGNLSLKIEAQQS